MPFHSVLNSNHCKIGLYNRIWCTNFSGSALLHIPLFNRNLFLSEECSWASSCISSALLLLQLFYHQKPKYNFRPLLRSLRSKFILHFPSSNLHLSLPLCHFFILKLAGFFRLKRCLFYLISKQKEILTSMLFCQTSTSSAFVLYGSRICLFWIISHLSLLILHHSKCFHGVLGSHGGWRS